MRPQLALIWHRRKPKGVWQRRSRCGSRRALKHQRCQSWCAEQRVHVAYVPLNSCLHRNEVRTGVGPALHTITCIVGECQGVAFNG